MATREDGTCPFTWNPGEWPYVTRCQFSDPHPGRHLDKKGRTPPPDMHAQVTASAAVVSVLTDPDHRGPSLHRDKCRTLAMEWPVLAAALAELIEAAGGQVPQPLRRARETVLRESSR